MRVSAMGGLRQIRRSSGCSLSPQERSTRVGRAGAGVARHSSITDGSAMGWIEQRQARSGRLVTIINRAPTAMPTVPFWKPLSIATELTWLAGRRRIWATAVPIPSSTGSVMVVIRLARAVKETDRATSPRADGSGAHHPVWSLSSPLIGAFRSPTRQEAPSRPAQRVSRSGRPVIRSRRRAQIP
jgi:hypothetical protein